MYESTRAKKLEPRYQAPASAHQDVLRHLERISHLLDDAVPIPGTSRRVGLDILIGLVPGLGDGIGALLSSYIVLMGARVGVPVFALVRMGANVAIETVVGAVPLLGDLFDMGWKANRRNVHIIRTHADRGRLRQRSWGRIGAYIAIPMLLVLLAAVTAAVYLVGVLVGLVV